MYTGSINSTSPMVSIVTVSPSILIYRVSANEVIENVYNNINVNKIPIYFFMGFSFLFRLGLP